MTFLSKNIKYLRKSDGLTQEKLALKIGVNRAMVGSYEEGRAIPKLTALQTLSHYFNVSLDDLVNKDLSLPLVKSDISGTGLRVLSTMITPENKELITVVPAKAAAGYLNGYGDPEYIESLPKFALPLPELSGGKTYRAFQIEGESMQPVPSGAYILCEFIQNWNEVSDGRAYILVTRDEGIVYKRIYNRIKANNDLLLKSDNPEYEPYTISVEQVMDIWKALGYISFNLPDPNDMSINKLSRIVMNLQKEVENLKSTR